MKLHRDSSSNALINMDEEGYKQARQRKTLRQKTLIAEHESQSLKMKINSLENRLQAIESMLESLNK